MTATTETFIPEAIPSTDEEWAQEIVASVRHRFDYAQKTMVENGEDIEVIDQSRRFVDAEQTWAENTAPLEVFYARIASRFLTATEEIKERRAGQPSMRISTGAFKGSLEEFKDDVVNDIEFANWTKTPRR